MMILPKNTSIIIDGKTVKAEIGKSILHAALNEKIDISSVCAGRGSCAKCRVIIKEGSDLVRTPNKIERTYLDEDELGEGYRLYHA